MAATMAEVAKLAKVGIGTVSRVVNNSCRVRDQTRQRVLAAINQLGYRQNRIARALEDKGGYARTIGILSPLFSIPVYQLVMMGIHAEASASGYHLLLTSPPPGADLASAVERVVRQFHVDGIVTVGTLGHGTGPIRPLIGDLMPAVCVSRSAPDAVSVISDNVKGGQLAAQHLWDRGCRRPAMLRTPRHPARCASFVEFFRQKGIGDVEDRTLNITEYVEKEGYTLTERLLASDPDGFFYGSDLMAPGGLRKLEEVGRKLPVVGYNGMAFAGPIGLTTVDQQFEVMGRIAFELLVQQVEGHRPVTAEKPECHVVTPQLVVRKT